MKNVHNIYTVLSVADGGHLVRTYEDHWDMLRFHVSQSMLEALIKTITEKESHKIEELYPLKVTLRIEPCEIVQPIEHKD